MFLSISTFCPSKSLLSGSDMDIFFLMQEWNDVFPLQPTGWLPYWTVMHGHTFISEKYTTFLKLDQIVQAPAISGSKGWDASKLSNPRPQISFSPSMPPKFMISYNLEIGCVVWTKDPWIVRWWPMQGLELVWNWDLVPPHNLVIASLYNTIISGFLCYLVISDCTTAVSTYLCQPLYAFIYFYVWRKE